MPGPKTIYKDLSLRPSILGPIVNVINQESWSEKEQYFQVSFSRPIGRRGGYSDVYIPPEPSEDGIFFFTYNINLYIWQKARMNDAVIKMLLQSKLIDENTYKNYLVKGMKSLETTLYSK